jgi:hypothetical protein
MAEPLENLAHRMEGDPFFLGCFLKLFADSAHLEENDLALRLGCSVKNLTLLRLCRAPRSESRQFQKDIARIAATYKVDADALIEAVRRGQALLALRQPSSSDAGILRAARDGEPQKGNNP